MKLSKEIQEALKKKRQKSWVSPMLAKLVKKPFSHPNWIYEDKLDGIRCLVFKVGDSVSLYSRNHNRLNKTHPEIVKAFESQKTHNFIVDGEIVAFEGRVTSFSKLQQAKKTKIATYFYAFDLLHVGDFDTKHLKLIDRKKILKQILHFGARLRYLRHRAKFGEKYFKEAGRRGLEGLIAKRGDSTYKCKRSSDWQKFKCGKSSKFVIGGYTDPQGGRIGFGALLIGFRDQKGQFRYAGKVGTGYDTELLRKLGKRLKNIERKKSPFKEKNLPKRAHFVSPTIKVTIEFTEWTNDKKLRHPRFIGFGHGRKN